jgi:Flp pilus assembly pilin Flp
MVIPAAAGSAYTESQPAPCEEGATVPNYLDSLRDEAGQTMAEYAVVLGVIVIAVVVTLGLLSTKITSVLSNVVASM